MRVCAQAGRLRLRLTLTRALVCVHTHGGAFAFCSLPFLTYIIDGELALAALKWRNAGEASRPTSSRVSLS